MRDKRIIYEHTQKYRAETFRFMGYVLCTPFCVLVLMLITNPKDLEMDNLWFIVRILFAIAFVPFGVKSALRGNTIMVNLDESLYDD